MDPSQPVTDRQRVDVVTFDFFNTLVRHRHGDGGRGRKLMDYLRSQGLAPDPWEHRVLYDVFEQHALDYSPDLAPARKDGYLCLLAERVFRRLGVEGGTEVAADHAAGIWTLIGPDSLETFPEVRHTLERLHAGGYRLGVVSNWHCGLGHFCVELGLDGLFEHVVASAEIGAAKPNRTIFEEVCRRFEVWPERVLHVGDTLEDDVEGAGRAGMRAVLISRDGTAPGFAGPSIRSLDGVLRVLEMDVG